MQKEQFDNCRDQEVLFLHIVLSAYRGVIKNILGTGSAIFESPTFEAVKKILEDEGIVSIKGNNLEEALENHVKMLRSSGLVEEVLLEKIGSHKYMFHIGKCIYAKRLHHCLKPFLNGQICPHAILPVLISQKFLKKKAKINSSDFTDEGSRTIIQL